MQLARRGWHLAGKKIKPKNVDGHVQALMMRLLSKDLDIPQPKWCWGKKDKAGGAATWKQCVGNTTPPRAMCLNPKPELWNSDVPHIEGAKAYGSTTNTICESEDQLPTFVGMEDQMGMKTIKCSRDTEDNGKPRHPRWTKPSNPRDTVYRAREGLTDLPKKDEEQQPKWGEGIPPPGVREMNLTQMEEGARKVAVVRETWKSAYVDEPFCELGILPK